MSKKINKGNILEKKFIKQILNKGNIMKTLEVSRNYNAHQLMTYIENYFEKKKVRFDPQYLYQGKVFVVLDKKGKQVAGATVIEGGAKKMYHSLTVEQKKIIGVLEGDIAEITGIWIDRKNSFPSKLSSIAAWFRILKAILTTSHSHFLFCVDGNSNIVPIYERGNPTLVAVNKLYHDKTKIYYASRSRLWIMFFAETLYRIRQKFRKVKLKE